MELPFLLLLVAALGATGLLVAIGWTAARLAAMVRRWLARRRLIRQPEFTNRERTRIRHDLRRAGLLLDHAPPPDRGRAT